LEKIRHKEWRFMLNKIDGTTKAAARHSYDIIIEHGMIVGGTGISRCPGDLGIHAGHLTGIGDLRDVPATRRIDAQGLIVAPGFIDIHTHADERIEKFPLARNYMHQGVTTIVGGQCGESIYPIGERLASLEKVGLGVNFAMLVGHSTIRKQVMGRVNRSPTGDEMGEMKALLALAMEQGAFGISTGLYYAPGSYSETEEVIELARTAARYGGLYASHIRDEGDFGIGLVSAVKEAIEIGEAAKIPVQISHLKTLGRGVWRKSTEILDLIEEARARGVDVTFDQYPYVASETSLIGAVVPGWAQAGDESRLKEGLMDPSTREKIRDEMVLSIEKRGGSERLFIARFNPDASLEGKNLEEIGRMMAKAPVDAAIEMLLAGEAEVISFNMSEEDLIRIMRSPVGMVASDSGLAGPGQRARHPRYYGTFPRVLGSYVRDKGVLTLEEAIRKMTSGPARRLGLPDRGVIGNGMVADITIFDPETVADRASFEDPSLSPEGIEYVIVDGQVTLSEGQWTGAHAGKVLYGPGLR
jgi:N-acyl-D-amino-acid deacylase